VAAGTPGSEGDWWESPAAVPYSVTRVTGGVELGNGAMVQLVSGTKISNLVYKEWNDENGKNKPPGVRGWYI
jgi:hypothetical protein